MSGEIFLFVYNDHFGKIRHQAQTGMSSLPERLSTVELFNLQDDELLTITDPNAMPVWETLEVA